MGVDFKQKIFKNFMQLPIVKFEEKICLGNRILGLMKVSGSKYSENLD